VLDSPATQTAKISVARAKLNDRVYWVLLSMVPQIGPSRFRRLLDVVGEPEATWKAKATTLAQAGLDRRAIDGIVQLRDQTDAAEVWRRLERLGVSVITWSDAAYPEHLREIADSPPILYLKGELLSADRWAVSVVGTRRVTAYGRQVVERLVAELARSGVTIVSGLARGVDALGHRVALEAGGRTLAVLGSGLDRLYPTEHAALARDIAARGAIITEFPLGTPPDAVNFPRRNRIISGLSMGTLVVEAGETSGALITADFALEQGREVFAVPGSILSPASAGSNRLIQEGAKLVASARDVLEELNLTAVAQHEAVREALPENETEAALLRVLSSEPVHVDELGRTSALPVAEVSSALTMMELKGLVRQIGGMNYVRT
jgi:DNA processing protein